MKQKNEDAQNKQRIEIKLKTVKAFLLGGKMTAWKSAWKSAWNGGIPNLAKEARCQSSRGRKLGAIPCQIPDDYDAIEVRE